MDQKIKDIIIKAEDLSRKIKLLQNEKTLPVIELDIILLDIRTLYEDIRTLQSASPLGNDAGKAVVNEPPPAEKTVETSPVEVPPAKTQPVGTSAEEEPPAKTSPDETPTVESVAEQAVPSEEAVPQKEVAKPKSPEKSDEPTILADKYKGEKRYINESLAGKLEKNDIGSKIQSTPIQNIGSALGINDRFLRLIGKFINHIFVC